MYSDIYLSEIVERFDVESVADEEIVNLIYELAHSGEIIKFSNKVFDFASTGGPSSLTTLLVPLYLYGFGMNVINLAVSGRPAGAVDVLSQIVGYDLDTVQDGCELKKPFYIHLAANENFAPLDKALFEYRKKIGKVNVPNLAIASLMSKKVASGASNIGLDVRVSAFGNFGRNWDECIGNAVKFNKIASLLGIKSTCFLSDADSPYQRYIGRGEALEALHAIIMGIDDSQLLDHKKYCMDIACRLIEEAGKTVMEDDVDLKRCFEDNLVFQGSNFDNFLFAVERIKKQPHHSICASEDGFIKYNLQAIRSYVVCRQQEQSDMGKYPDPCGVTLLIDEGRYVTRGTPIISVRNWKNEDNGTINQMYTIQQNPLNAKKRKEVI